LKELIKFAWGLLKTEDTSVKQSAYVLICRFIKEYETPNKIVTQTYVAQLRAHQIEIRPMVKQALDSIIPVLHDRNGMGQSDRNGINNLVPVWVQWIRKTIIEDGHSQSQLVSLYKLIIRNSDDFYSSCEHFLTQMARLGLSNNSTAETKALCIEIANCLYKWETRAIEESDSMDVDGAEKGSVVSTPNIKEIIVTFLLRFSLSLTDPTLNKVLFPKALKIFAKFLRIWPNVSITLVQLTKVVSMEITDSNLPFVLNASEILKTIIDCKSTLWVSTNISLFQSCVEKWSNNPNLQLLSSLSLILTKCCTTLDDPEIEDTAKLQADRISFFKTVDQKLHERIKTGTCICTLSAILNLVYISRIKQSVSLRSHLSELVVFLQTCITDYIISYGQEGTKELLPEHIESIINVLNSQMLNFFGGTISNCGK